MKQLNLKYLLGLAKDASIKAGNAIMKVYRDEDFDLQFKSDDSPLTKADNAAHDIIVKCLYSSGIPVLSEEGKNFPFDERKLWEYFWLVDPLDGTKEFIKRNGEFTVNIALIHFDNPILGIVYAPAIDKLFLGGIATGVFFETANEIIELKKRNSIDLHSEGLRVVASRSHLSIETQVYMEQLNSPTIISMGSSLKFMAIAENKADLYPRFSPTMEWDTAAAHAILNGLNIPVKTVEGKNLVYNKENLLNPSFTAG